MKPTWGNPDFIGQGKPESQDGEVKRAEPDSEPCSSPVLRQHLVGGGVQPFSRRYSAAWSGQAKRRACEHRLAVCVRTTASKSGEKHMTVKVLVMSDRPDEYTGKKGLVKQQIITVMDVSDTGERLAQPIEYALSDEEKPGHAGKLQDKVINLGIRELIPFGGRLRARGKIVGLVGK
jgi:hypothetical protein